MVVAAVAMLTVAGYADAQTYAYDGNGRLVAATVSSGESVRYVYDDMGNLQQVISVPAGSLSIFALTPNHGSPGVPVTIRGQGFSASAADNAVRFQGTAATVTAATATALTTSVPAGAVTGPVSVTVAGKTVTSDDSFVVDGTGLPPTITSVTPGIVDVGAAVTALGSHLQPVLGQTSLLLNDQVVKPTSTADTTITFVAPGTVGSGRVVIQTPFGVARSSGDLVIVPSVIGAASIGAVGRMTPSSPLTLSVPASKYGVVLFDAADSVATQWVSVQNLALTGGATSVSYSVYDPRSRLVASGTFSATAPSIHLPKVMTRGTYSFYFKPSGTAPTTVTTGMEFAPSLSVDAPTATPVLTTVGAQSKRFILVAAPGMALQIPGIVTTPTGGTVTLTVNDQAGNKIGSTTGTSNIAYNIPALKLGASYQVIVGGSAGTALNASILLKSVPGGHLTIDGPTLNVKADPGVNAVLSFTAAPTDRVSFALSGLTASASVNLYDEAGTYIQINTSCSASNPGGDCRFALSNLAGGTYRVVVAATSTTLPMTFAATLTSEVSGSLKVGVPVNVNWMRPGQSGRLTFDAAKGDTLALALSNIATSPAGQGVTISVLRPDGTALGSDVTLSSGGAVNMQNLPVSGTYTVSLRQYYGVPMSFTLLLAPQAGTTLAIDGQSATASPEVGQNGYFTFTAGAGDNLELALSAATIRTSCTGITASVYDSKGNFITGGTLYSGVLGLSKHLWGLAAGDYSVSVTCMTSGTMTLTRDIVADVSMGQTQAFNLARNGQTLRMTFTGKAGDTVAVGAQDFATTPANKAVTTTVLGPSGASLASADSSTPALINLKSLAASGIYTVIVSPDYGIPASVTASVLPQAGGLLVADAASTTITTAAGQNGYFTFNAAAGENLELALNNVTVGKAGNLVNMYVYGPTGTTIGNSSVDPTSTARSSRVSLPNLAAGIYSVTVSSSSNSSPFSATATFTHDVTGTLTVGGTTPIVLSRQGQVARYTFAGTAGQALVLGLPSYTTTPSGQTLNVVFTRPDGTTRQGSATMLSGNTYSIPSLPVTGTYTVTLSPSYGVPATMSVSLK